MSSEDDDECFAVQLDGSGMYPSAQKTILRQRFPMRRYNLERDGRLTNLAKAMEGPVDDVARYSTSSVNAGDAITESVMTILQPHTSSPSLRYSALAIASLMAGKFGDDDLRQILNVQLDTLAISSQAKQSVVPALVGIAKLAELHSRDAPMPQSQTRLLSTLSRSDGGASVDTLPGGASVPYQARQRSFASNSGSGHTIWYSGKSDTNIPLPPVVPQAVTGHLYVHLNTSTNTCQYWMLGGNNQWESVSKGSEYPLNHDRVFSIRSNGEPSWVTRASTVTTQSRKERETREKSVHA